MSSGRNVRTKRPVSNGYRNIQKIPVKYREHENDIPETSKLHGRNLFKLHPFRGVDYMVLALVVILVLFGLVMIFSSSYYYAMTEAKFYNDKFFFVTKQAKSAVLGLVAMLLCMSINTEVFRRLSRLAYLLIGALLLAVFALGVVANGANRWLEFMGTSLQPSEFAKFMIIIFMSDYVIKNQRKLTGNFKTFIIGAFPLLVIAGLVAIENLSTGIVIAVVGIAIMFVASDTKRVRNFVALGIFGVLGATGFTLAKSYRRERITGWLNPWADQTNTGYQIIQSLYAVASGGLFGLGIGQSRQKTFIPESYNDIIFAVICEELGLVGALVVIMLFVLLIWRGTKIAMTAKDKYSSYCATGITAMIAVQVIINIAVVTNSMPNTGMPMPFISYGGTSLVVMMASMGLLLNISADCRR